MGVTPGLLFVQGPKAPNILVFTESYCANAHYYWGDHNRVFQKKWKLNAPINSKKSCEKFFENFVFFRSAQRHFWFWAPIQNSTFGKFQNYCRNLVNSSFDRRFYTEKHLIKKNFSETDILRNITSFVILWRHISSDLSFIKKNNRSFSA